MGVVGTQPRSRLHEAPASTMVSYVTAMVCTLWPVLVLAALLLALVTVWHSRKRGSTVMGLMRWAGYTTIAAACRCCAVQPTAALHRIGIALANCIGLWGEV